MKDTYYVVTVSFFSIGPIGIVWYHATSSDTLDVQHVQQFLTGGSETLSQLATRPAEEQEDLQE